MPRVYVEVYGCSANQADAEIASGLLTEAGHLLVGSEEEADVSVIMTCIVKTPTEIKIARRLRELVVAGRKVVIAGCMPKALRSLVEEIAPNASMVGPDDLVMMPEAVEKTCKGRRVIFLDGSSPNRTLLPRERHSSVIHIAPIASGCLGNCSYCIVKRARGRLYSFPSEGIVEDARRAVHSGCKEIWITAEDTAAYDSNGVRLPELVERINGIEGRFMIRIGMMTPNTALPIIDRLVDSFKLEKVFRFLHVPVQSGNDEVLSLMRRKYIITEFKEVIEVGRKAIPNLGISTDLICGFPGETEAQFKDSLSLVEWLKPDSVNISRFWPRPGTEAAGLEGQIHGRTTKDRSRRLNELWRRVQMGVNKRWIGWEGEVLLDEKGHSGAKVGRNASYKAVVIRTEAQLGDSIEVRVNKAGRGFLFGEEMHSRIDS
jgi:threonylcarbamoyladenosine tRNA methylthiotransferase CDKAL1